jgi:hypothetical protein
MSPAAAELASACSGPGDGVAVEVVAAPVDVVGGAGDVVVPGGAVVVGEPPQPATAASAAPVSASLTTSRIITPVWVRSSDRILNARARSGVVQIGVARFAS